MQVQVRSLYRVKEYRALEIFQCNIVNLELNQTDPLVLPALRILREAWSSLNSEEILGPPLNSNYGDLYLVLSLSITCNVVSVLKKHSAFS